jgi:hypothetical protein
LGQLLGDEKVDICTIQQIRLGTISIPGFETVVYFYSPSTLAQPCSSSGAFLGPD